MISIREFRSDDVAAFVQLNRQWIEAYFDMEVSDSTQLNDPEGVIIAQGGKIAIAELDNRIVGCGALVPPHHTPDDGRRWIELVKFATDPSAQGKGVGTAILTRLIEWARESGHDAIWLETNDRLAAATHVYKKHGFRKLACAESWPTPYTRCNLQMVRILAE